MVSDLFEVRKRCICYIFSTLNHDTSILCHSQSKLAHQNFSEIPRQGKGSFNQWIEMNSSERRKNNNVDNFHDPSVSLLPGNSVLRKDGMLI